MVLVQRVSIAERLSVAGWRWWRGWVGVGVGLPHYTWRGNSGATAELRWRQEALWQLPPFQPRRFKDGVYLVGDDLLLEVIVKARVVVVPLLGPPVVAGASGGGVDVGLTEGLHQLPAQKRES